MGRLEELARPHRSEKQPGNNRSHTGGVNKFTGILIHPLIMAHSAIWYAKYAATSVCVTYLHALRWPVRAAPQRSDCALSRYSPTQYFAHLHFFPFRTTPSSTVAQTTSESNIDVDGYKFT